MKCSILFVIGAVLVASCAIEVTTNRAWKACKDDPCSSKCEEELREKYCDGYPDDPKCEGCWPITDAGEIDAEPGEGGLDASVDAQLDSATDAGAADATAAGDAADDARSDAARDAEGDGTVLDSSPQCRRNDQCPAGTPVCAFGVCVGCKGNGDCAARAETPACEVATGECVECSASQEVACAARGLVCEKDGTKCVGCNGPEECSMEAAPRCGGNHVCTTCEVNADCGRWGKICDLGQCVQCTPATEVEQCRDLDPSPGDQGLACNPGTKTCGGRPRGSVSGCGACVSDSECAAGSRCVVTLFAGTAQGMHCMQIAPSGPCPNGAPIKQTATSVLGISASYCFPDPSQTTCEAILDFREVCAADAECGADDVDDGLCVGAAGAKRCTYECSGNADCVGGSCTGPVGAKYCNPN